jgi:hypothetical protein
MDTWLHHCLDFAWLAHVEAHGVAVVIECHPRPRVSQHGSGTSEAQVARKLASAERQPDRRKEPGGLQYANPSQDRTECEAEQKLGQGEPAPRLTGSSSGQAVSTGETPSQRDPLGWVRGSR